ANYSPPGALTYHNGESDWPVAAIRRSQELDQRRNRRVRSRVDDQVHTGHCPDTALEQVLDRIADGGYWPRLSDGVQSFGEYAGFAFANVGVGVRLANDDPGRDNAFVHDDHVRGASSNAILCNRRPQRATA